MSKSKRSGKKQNSKFLGDVTIDDFANARVLTNRTKKSTLNLSQVIKNEIVEDNVEEPEETVTKKLEPRRRRKTISENKEVETGANVYPLDIWFLLSNYIRPEDVGRFAGICKSSYIVVNSAKFWFSLYKRYYKSVPTLPERLQPDCMSRLYGVRTSVIRALHYMYTPFVDRISSKLAFEVHPDTLLKRQCVLMWYHHQGKNKWLYYFKLKENVNLSLSHTKRNSRQPDVTANPDENCRTLLVTCSNFIAVPLVQGLTLTAVSLSLSHGLTHHKLELTFGSKIMSVSPSMISFNECPVILLDPVINLKVLDWWHPQYPFNYSIHHNLFLS